MATIKDLWLNFQFASVKNKKNSQELLQLHIIREKEHLENIPLTSLKLECKVGNIFKI